MIWLATGASLVAAGLNAGSSVLQRLATGKPEAKHLFGRRFVLDVTFSRLFLLGMTLQISGFLMQGLALANGPLTLVQPLLTTDLIFLLVIMRARLGVKTGLRDWLAVMSILLGLSLMLVAANPRNGSPQYAILPWVLLVSIATPLVTGMIIVVRHLDNPSMRGLLAGLAAGGAFSLNAAFTKLMLNQLSLQGPLGVLSSWPVYALITSGFTSLYLMLNTYGAGPLTVTQPTLEISEPVMSIAIGIFIFGEEINHTGWSLASEIAGLLMLSWGIIALASSRKLHQAGRKGV